MGLVSAQTTRQMEESGSFAWNKLYSKYHQLMFQPTLPIKQWKMLMEYAPFGMSIVDPQGTYLYVNDQLAKKIHKVTEKNHRRRHVRDVLGEKAWVLLEPQLKRVLKTKQIHATDFSVVSKRHGNNMMHFHASYFPIMVKDRVVAIGITVQDVSSQKNSERLVDFENYVGKELNKTLDYRSAVKKIAKFAVNKVVDWCAMEVLSDDGVMELVALEHKDKQKATEGKLIWKEYRANNAKNTIDEVFRTRHTIHVPDIKKVARNSSESTQYEAFIKAAQLRSIIITPMVTTNGVIGVMVLATAESKRRLATKEVQSAKKVASLIGISVENSHLYERMRTDQERLDNLLQQVPAIVWESISTDKGETHLMTYVSPEVERLLGYSRSQWTEVPNFWLSVIHKDDQQQAFEERKEMLASEQGGISRFRYISKKGKEIWVEVQTTVLKNKKGEAIGLRGVTIDISEAMKAVEQKDTFMSMASHELKTPITTIKAFTQLLKIIKNRQKQSLYLDKMEIQVDKLTRLVTDLLDVTRIAQGKLLIEKKPINVDELVEDTVETMKETTKGQKFQITLGANVQVEGDSDRLSQVIINLLSNAIKYSLEEKPIVVTTKKDEKNAYIAVKDYGYGISSNDLQKIFERFYRVADNPIRPGLGIGLYVSMEIMKMHGGNITVESVPGEGSTFTMTIPLLK